MTFTSVTVNSEALQHVSCMWYLVQFQENQLIETLIDSRSEVNAMNPTYAAKLGLVTRKTDVDAQKIDGLTLITYEMVLVGFSVQDKLTKVWLFEETFLLSDTSIEVVLRIPFLTLSDADVQFVEKEL